MKKVANKYYSKEQEYMQNKSVDRVRSQFRMRTEMMESFKYNYRAKHRTLERKTEILAFSATTIVARSMRDIARHIAFGARHGQILEVTTIMEDLVTYFRRVRKARTECEEEDRKKRSNERKEEEKRRKDGEGAKTNKRRRAQ